ncbi:FAD-dependent monooxygenase [Aldersonia sp. NBC_00410]|uniref:FAD-dependent oxidoreductase n=1 Tax=Aldersonia sp. NBC_00410 TaxID=2975954 RepID=UPI002252BC1F|nr:NAD(P)/FAD-dependent oxidoreductase [Aldersonia sp. NBC_00410]MCX5042690.1 FAD-dependent monooxygenase [Aldersonia sp. NBC_00410]
MHPGRRLSKSKASRVARPVTPLRVLVIGAGVGGIAVARGLLQDGHDVTVFERMPEVRTGGGAVTIWSNGATVLRQLGVDMDGAGEQLSTVRVVTSGGRPIATIDVTAISATLGAPTRMVPRRVLLERLLAGFPTDRIQCGSPAVRVLETPEGARVEFADGSAVDGDLVIGADGRHSMVREMFGAQAAEPTGWCSWQGLISLPEVADNHDATIIIGEHGNLGLWPAGGSQLQWWFDLPWSTDFVRPDRPIEMVRAQFSGWSEATDRVLATLTDADLDLSPFPHYRHPIPREWGQGPFTLLGDAAHTIPPTLAQGTNQALLDAMILRRALTSAEDLSRALRGYEKMRRRKVAIVSWLTSLQVSHAESALRPAALIPDRFMTWILATFLRAISHRDHLAGFAPA